MNPEQLNDAFDALMTRIDMLDVDDATARSLNAVLSDWQDFYWGELDQWPVNMVAVWRDNLRTLTDRVAALEASAGRITAPRKEAPPAGPTVQAEVVRIVGTWPTWLKVAAGSALALALYKVARVKKWL